MQRLYLQFYVTILIVLAVFVGAAVLLWRLADDDNRTPQYLDVAAELTGALLPDSTAPRLEQQRAIEGLQRKLRFDIALYEPDGDMIAMAGKPPPRFEPKRARTGWRRGPGGPNFVLQLPDGRWLVARQVRERPNPIFWIAAALGLVAVAVAIASFPVVRGLGRRLERLKAGVDRLGGGDLGARVKVEGRDEVAALAASFNRSAERIEALVAAHRLLLANASHELRTPLTRISVAASLLGDAADPKTRESLKRDVAELDQLIEQILLASRLEALPTLEQREPIDLLALAAEEASHYDVEVDGEPASTRFIEAEIKPLQAQDDNERFFDHRREWARTDFDNGGPAAPRVGGAAGRGKRAPTRRLLALFAAQGVRRPGRRQPVDGGDPRAPGQQGPGPVQRPAERALDRRQLPVHRDAARLRHARAEGEVHQGHARLQASGSPSA
jgi:HAMP domain-containing protein